mmetsp:Transcript_44334/g.79523  ORF Transcript_44334/g.79523 Transcript_44334/m.79523 type:complete len:244 (-) Transcript_44334:1110-1841(-)
MVRCNAEHNAPSMDWNSASRYVASSERIWEASAAAAGWVEEDPIRLNWGDCGGDCCPLLLSSPSFSSVAASFSSSSTCDNAPFVFFRGYRLLSGSPKKSKYNAVSTVHNRIRNTEAKRVMPTNPCLSLNISICVLTVLVNNVSLPPQYVLRHNINKSSYDAAATLPFPNASNLLRAMEINALLRFDIPWKRVYTNDASNLSAAIGLFGSNKASWIWADVWETRSATPTRSNSRAASCSAHARR